MTVNLPRGKFIQVTGRPTQDNTGRQAQAAQSGAEAFASDGSNIQFGPINPDVLPIATSTSLGVVEPDNVTITVDPSGIISAVVPSVGDYTLPHPGYKANRYYTMPIFGVTPKTLSINTLYAHPFFVATSVTFTKATIRCTAGVAASSARFGIYANDATNACPGALIQDFGSVPTIGTSDQTISGLTISLVSSTIYWLCVGSNGGIGLEGVAGNQSSLMNWFTGQGSTNGTTVGYQTAWTYAGALPNPYPTTTPTDSTSQIPVIYLSL